MAVTSTSVVPNELLTVYATEAILQAQPNLIFRRFVDYKRQIGMVPGKQIQFLKRANITAGGKIANEFTPVPTQSLSSSVVDVSMFEFGNSVQLTRLASEESFRDLLFDSSLGLGQDYATVLDAYLRDTWMTTANVQFAGGVGAVGSILAGSVFSVAEIMDAVETLKTANVPPVYRNGNGEYICALHPHQARSIRNDARWINAHNYTTPENIYRGEIGRFENVVFLETTQMTVTASAGAASQSIYDALVWGDRPVAFGELVPFQLLIDPPQDLARFIRLGWYSIMGAGILNDYIVNIKTS